MLVHCERIDIFPLECIRYFHQDFDRLDIDNLQRMSICMVRLIVGLRKFDNIHHRILQIFVRLDIERLKQKIALCVTGNKE